MAKFGSLLVLTAATGSVYALAATGLVLTYKTSRVFNFAHGAVAMFSAYVFRELWVDQGVPLPIAAAIVVVVAAPLAGAAFERVLFRPLREASTAVKIVVTVGLLISLQGLAAVIWGEAGLFVPPFVPTRSVGLPGGVAVGLDQLLILAVALGATGGLALVLNRTRFGLEIRAVVDRPDLAELAKVRSGRVSAIAWGLGFAAAALAGILLSPVLGLDTFTLTLLVIQAYAAALIGRLSSLGFTFLGGLVIAFFEQGATLYLPQTCDLCRTVRPATPFILMFVLLGAAALAPRTRLGGWIRSAAVQEQAAPPPLPRRAPGRLGARTILPAAAVAVAALGPLVGDRWLLRLAGALTITGVFVSLNVLTGMSGQISLGHTAFVGTGAFVMGALGPLPFPLALFVAGLAAVPVGLVVALPAIRLQGLYLALLTFGYGLVASSLFSSGLTNAASGVEVARPSFARTDLGYFYVLLALVVGLLWAASNLERSPSGRILAAIRDSDRGARSIGIDPAPYKLAAFTLSAFIAGVAGGALAAFQTVVTFNDFNIFFSLVWLAVAVIGGIGTIWGAAAAGAVWLLGTVGSQSVGQVFFGLGAILLARNGRGIAGVLAALPGVLDRFSWLPRRAVERYAGGPVRTPEGAR